MCPEDNPTEPILPIPMKGGALEIMRRHNQNRLRTKNGIRLRKPVEVQTILPLTIDEEQDRDEFKGSSFFLTGIDEVSSYSKNEVKPSTQEGTIIENQIQESIKQEPRSSTAGVLYKVVHPSGARIKQEASLISACKIVAPIGTIFESNQEVSDINGIKFVKFQELNTIGWIIKDKIIERVEELNNEGTITSNTKINPKERVLEIAKEKSLWKRLIPEASFYELDLMERQQRWIQSKEAKIKQLEVDKELDLAKYLSLAPDVGKAKDSWQRAKKQHDEEILKSKVVEQTKQSKEQEVIQKRNLKLAEKVQELKRLSRLNEEMINEGELIKPKKLKKRKKLKQRIENYPIMTEKTNEKDYIEYSTSTLDLLIDSVLEENSTPRVVSAPTLMKSIDASAKSNRSLTAPSRREECISRNNSRGLSSQNPGSNSEDLAAWLQEELNKRKSTKSIY